MANEPDHVLRLMLIGESDVGKSHYGGQLLLRLNEKVHALQMRGAATNISAFDGVAKALNDGKSAKHTSATTYVNSLWPVLDADGRAIDLEWPDYGGEQVKKLVDERKVPLAWRERLLNADGWMLMVRIGRSAVEDDIFSKPLADMSSRRLAEGKEMQTSVQARLIELLQIMMYVRGVSSLRPLGSPALSILLSCWDELGSEGVDHSPSEVLRRRMPLVASFVESNWKSERLDILGLSALERPLHPERVDEDYVDRGPEHFGYVVLADGTRKDDLSLPVARLARIIGPK